MHKMQKFRISNELIKSPALIEEIRRVDAGALATFEGWIRNHNEGKQVTALSYEVFVDLALSEGEKILEETKDKFKVLDAICVHRQGDLSLGEMAVFVGVVSAHRQEAFAACKYIIDEIKHRLPIWKKEFFADGSHHWVNCNHNSSKTHTSIAIKQADLYQQQINLKEIGLDGQAKLQAAKIIVVGAGGLGSAALQYLTAAGVGEIAIVEADRLEASNLNRQVIYKAKDLGKVKVDLAKEALLELNPFVIIKTFNEYLSPDNIDAILSDYNLVLDCTDNFAAKFLLNDYCLSHNKTLVQASVYQFEGQIQIAGIDRNGQLTGQCLRCLYPKAPHEISTCENTEKLIAPCSQTGIIGATAGILGNLQALEAIKLILGMESPLSDHVIYIDLTTLETRKIKARRRPDCPACSNSPDDKTGPASTNGPNATLPETSSLEIALPDFAREDLAKYVVIDIRETYEHPIENFPVEFEKWPLSAFYQWPALQPDKDYLFVCAHGIRSLAAARKLLELGHRNAFSLAGGFALFEAKRYEAVQL